jgi:murein DD-endopeptidase MepM/ murein hydrolase activator NlpD
VFERHPSYLTAPLHAYPVIDIPVPVGSAVYAIVGGTVAIAAPNSGICGGTIVMIGDDGARYTYCHLRQEFVNAAGRVRAGALIAWSGGQTGAYGSGDATGPHVHLGISVNGTNVCSQLLLSAWFASESVEPGAAPRTGCTS